MHIKRAPLAPFAHEFDPRRKRVRFAEAEPSFALFAVHMKLGCRGTGNRQCSTFNSAYSSSSSPQFSVTPPRFTTLDGTWSWCQDVSGNGRHRVRVYLPLFDLPFPLICDIQSSAGIQYNSRAEQQQSILTTSLRLLPTTKPRLIDCIQPPTHQPCPRKSFNSCLPHSPSAEFALANSTSVPFPSRSSLPCSPMQQQSVFVRFPPYRKLRLDSAFKIAPDLASLDHESYRKRS